MRRIRSTSAGFLVAEFVIISLGVLVALGADRWVRGLDEKTLTDTYMVNLQSDLRQDSASFNIAKSQAHKNVLNAGLLVSLLREGPGPTTDRKEVLVALYELSEWVPRGFRTVTWTDLLATGNLRLLDNDLRRELSVYYGMQPDRIESDDNQEPFRRYKSVASHLLKPEQQMMAMYIEWGGADPDTVSSAWEANDLPDPGIEVSTATTLSDDEFAALIDRLEATPGLEAMLGDMLWASIWHKETYQIFGSYAAHHLADPRVAGAAPVDTASS